jgi:predicted small secreted protein
VLPRSYGTPFRDRGFVRGSTKGTNLMKRLASLFALLLFSAGLCACETIQGAGRDIENVGEEIDEEVGN